MTNSKCDNQCFYGCSDHKSLVRVVDSKLKAMILVLCDKGLAEYSDCKITNLSKKEEEKSAA